MSRAGNEFGGPAKERSAWLIPLAVFLVTAVLIGMVIIWYIAPTPSELIEEQASPTSIDTPVVVKVGPQQFVVPANYLPFASARKGGSFSEAKLIALLPDLEGYSSGQAAEFSPDQADSRLLNIRLRAQVSLDERARLDRIYLPQVVNRDGSPGPFGLTQYTFGENSSYRDDELFVGQTDKGPAVMRCSRPLSDSLAASCIRELPIASGVSLSYRFKRTHLDEWRAIDTAVRALFARFMAK
jgi:hypothetical protein